MLRTFASWCRLGPQREGARKRITATVSPNASRWSHIKRALACCNPATICQGRLGRSQGTAAQTMGPGSCTEPEVLQVNAMNVNAAQLALISLRSDFKIEKGSRIYEGNSRHSKHEEKTQKY